MGSFISEITYYLPTSVRCRKKALKGYFVSYLSRAILNFM